MRLPLSLAIALLFAASPASAAVTAASYFGSTGKDSLTGVAIASDGAILISGNSDASSLGGPAARMLGTGGGFVAKLDRAGTKLVWFSWLEAAGQLGLTPRDEPIVVTGDHLTKLALDGSSVIWKTATLGSTVKSFAVAGSGAVAVLAGSHAVALAADGQTVLIDVPNVGRSNPSAVALEPSSGDLFVSGDHNAGYGTCGGPWRSPFIFRYDQSANRIWTLYDYAGQAACDVDLAADSFFSHLFFQPDGTLYTTGGADGGNTVLTRSAHDLAKNNPALAGACFASPCYGWKGAAAPRYVGRLKSDFSDFERSSFIVAHFNRAPPGCSCDVPQDDGSTARANSAGLDYVFPTSTGDVVGAGAAGWHFPTVNAWFPQAAYTPGYPAVLAVLDHDLKTMKMATLLPGTGSTQAAAYRGGRIVVVGNAPDNSHWTPPAGQETLAQATISAAPAGGALQADFGGGTQDGFIYVGCVTNESECSAVPPPVSGGGGGAVSGAGASSLGGAGQLTVGGQSSGGGAANATEGAATPDATKPATSGCSCAAVPRPQTNYAWVAEAPLFLLVCGRKRLRRRSRAR